MPSRYTREDDRLDRDGRWRALLPNDELPPNRHMPTREKLRRAARQAIEGRLGVAAPGAVISLGADPHDPCAVLLHLNSGGNSLACEQALAAEGYGIGPSAPAESGYSVVLQVTIPPRLVVAARAETGE